MNWEKLRKNIGWRMRLQPRVIHLNADGDALPEHPEDWLIVSAADEYLVINQVGYAGYSHHLGKDQIKTFSHDHNRSVGDLKYGLLTLNVQLKTQGGGMWHETLPLPGMGIPHSADKEVRAREHFAPELAQVMRSLVYTLDRATANCGITANGHNHCDGDTWKRIIPNLPVNYPASPLSSDLSRGDTRLLSEFYAVVSEIASTLDRWEGDESLDSYNAWNVLVQRTEHALDLGLGAVRKFCIDRQYDPNVPVAGTLISRVERSLSISRRQRDAFLKKHTRRF